MQEGTASYKPTTVGTPGTRYLAQHPMPVPLLSGPSALLLWWQSGVGWISMIWEVNGLENWTGKTKKEKLGRRDLFSISLYGASTLLLQNTGDK